jgi:hypothetical protein
MALYKHISQEKVAATKCGARNSLAKNKDPSLTERIPIANSEEPPRKEWLRIISRPIIESESIS